MTKTKKLGLKILFFIAKVMLTDELDSDEWDDLKSLQTSLNIFETK